MEKNNKDLPEHTPAGASTKKDSDTFYMAYAKRMYDELVTISFRVSFGHLTQKEITDVLCNQLYKFSEQVLERALLQERAYDLLKEYFKGDTAAAKIAEHFDIQEILDELAS